ncbi:MAG: cupin domain-containing protein [Geminicoccaceae bacterium]
MATTTVKKPAQAPDGSFPRGDFNIASAKGAEWKIGLRPHFEYRDLGIEAATGGKVLAQIIRARMASEGPGDNHKHLLDFQMVYILRGWMRTRFAGVGERTLEAGDCLYQQPGIHHQVLDYADDLELIEITIPADFETTTVAA